MHNIFYCVFCYYQHGHEIDGKNKPYRPIAPHDKKKIATTGMDAIYILWIKSEQELTNRHILATYLTSSINLGCIDMSEAQVYSVREKSTERHAYTS